MADTITRASPKTGLTLSHERVIVAGPGRVGLSIGRWLAGRGAHLLAYSGRGEPAPEAARIGAAGNEPPNPNQSPEWRPLDSLRSDDADVLIIAVADPALEKVAHQLAARPQAAVVLHVSGHFDADALAPIRRGPAASQIGSWHPLRAFTAPSSRLADAAGVTFAVDGDLDALRVARRFTAAVGGRVVEVGGAERRLYHLAASLAAGGVVTVLAAADRLRRAAGLPDSLMDSYLHLSRGALDQLPTTTPFAPGAFAASITGPAARGDQAMLDRQRDAVSRLTPELLPLIETLNSATRMLRRGADPESALEPSRIP